MVNIDYEKTIVAFFDSALGILFENLDKTQDKNEKNKIKQNIYVIGELERNPKHYADVKKRRSDKIIPGADGFRLKSGGDNSVYAAFNNMMAAIDNFYACSGGNEFMFAHAKISLLDANKEWWTAIEKRKFKKFLLSMKTPQYFAFQQK